MTIHIGLIGDCDLQVKAHVAIPLALELAASELGCKIKIAWLATPTLEQKGKQALAYYGAFWAVPG
ncbi:MAG TPA: hypothetical protein VFU49_21120, partial [Ktedonobacteraceae bacterium]|nr:hypothetical protein [Ktedonobacteraceae bacterium]